MSTFADFNNNNRTSQKYEEIDSEAANYVPSYEDKQGEAKQRDADQRRARAREKKLQRRAAVSNCMRRGSTGQRWVFFAFFACVTAGLLLYFLVPRAPDVAWNTAAPLTSSDSAPVLTTIPASFAFSANVSLDIDARSSYLALKLPSLSVEVYDTNTATLIGAGELASLSVPGRTITTVLVPIEFTGTFTNVSDVTYGSIAGSCRSEPTPLSLSLAITFYVKGLLGKKGAGTQLSSVTCPVTFAS